MGSNPIRCIRNTRVLAQLGERFPYKEDVVGSSPIYPIELRGKIKITGGILNMKTIIVTKQNIKEVYGRLRKFYNNKNSNGIIEWHNFDCGFKKHISPYINIGGKQVRVENKYSGNVKLRLEGMDKSEPYIIIGFSATDTGVVKVGDKLAFLGNRYIHREDWVFKHEYSYIYSTYQLVKMSYEEKASLDYQAEMFAEMNEDDLEDLIY